MPGRIEVLERHNMKYRGVAFRIELRRLYFSELSVYAKVDHWYIIVIELPNKDYGFPFLFTIPKPPSEVPEDKTERLNWLNDIVEKECDRRLDTVKSAERKPTKQLEMDL